MRRLVGSVVLVLGAAAGLPLPAAAQGGGQAPGAKQPSKTSVSKVKKTGWEAEIHFGSMQGDEKAPATGDTSLGQPGFPIQTKDAVTKNVSSFFFGTGAAFLNAAIGPNMTHMTALDPILTTPSANHPRGTAFGFRFGHSITSHAYAGVLFDLSASHLALTPDAVSTIQTSVSNFSTVMGAQLVGQVISGTTVSSSANVTDKVGTQMLMGFEANGNIGTFGRFTPFFGGGGGILLPRGGDVTAVLNGNYQFTITNGSGVSMVNETDHVTITWQSQPAILEFFDVGVKFHVTRRSGVRATYCLYMMRIAPLQIKVNAEPTAVPATGTARGTILRGAGSSELVFSNTPPDSLTQQQSFKSFEGADSVKFNRAVFTVGYFVKF